MKKVGFTHRRLVDGQWLFLQWKTLNKQEAGRHFNVSHPHPPQTNCPRVRCKAYNLSPTSHSYLSSPELAPSPKSTMEPPRSGFRPISVAEKPARIQRRNQGLNSASKKPFCERKGRGCSGQVGRTPAKEGQGTMWSVYQALLEPRYTLSRHPWGSLSAFWTLVLKLTMDKQGPPPVTRPRTCCSSLQEAPSLDLMKNGIRYSHHDFIVSILATSTYVRTKGSHTRVLHTDPATA